MTFTADIERVLTSENKNLSVDYYVMWRINDTVDYFLATHGDASRAETLLNQIVENDLLAEFSKRNMRQAIDDDRNEIVSVVQAKANKDTQQLGIEVVDVRIMHLDLPKKVREAVYSRMRSGRQEVIRALKAQGDALAQEIRSDADRERAAILADARAEAETIRGSADAQAAEIYAKAYEQNPTFYSFYRSLQLYREAIGDQDMLILQPEGQLFRYFNPGSESGSKPESGNKPKPGNKEP